MARQLAGTHIAILGGATLLGREIKDVVSNRGTLRRLSDYAVSSSGDKSEDPGELLNEKSLSGVAALLLAGTPADAQRAYELVKAANGRVPLIDCQGQLEGMPEARIAAPLLQEPEAAWWLTVIAHPAASAIALVITRLVRYRKLKAMVANIMEPASERGKPGVSELHQQTTALLTFKPLEKEIFDTQVSFNLLPRIGEDSPAQLAAIEARIDRHLATLLSREAEAAIPMPSIRLIQAPVFHGYTISAWVEFENDIDEQEVEEALASAQIEVRRQSEEPPDNVGAASQSGLIAGDIRVDRNNPHAVWIWIVMDNLRIVADAAADILRGISKSAPSGQNPDKPAR